MQARPETTEPFAHFVARAMAGLREQRKDKPDQPAYELEDEPTGRLVLITGRGVTLASSDQRELEDWLTSAGVADPDRWHCEADPEDEIPEQWYARVGVL